MRNPLNGLLACAEDDDARSSYARNLIQTPQNSPTPWSGAGDTIPKVIIQFWDNLSRLPKDVQECLDTWRPLVSDGFSRLIFDDQTARRFIIAEFGPAHAKAFDLCYHPAMRCDYFRLCYILSQGGFYVDADELYRGADCNHLFIDHRLKIQPLCYDTETGQMVQPDMFLTNRQFSPKWIFYFNNNPIISPAGHPVIRIALQRATRILLASEKLPDIQSTTGPGNLTASVVRYAVSQEFDNKPLDFLILPNWEAISVSHWPLSYRDDVRNWRLSIRKKFLNLG